jgi:diaminopimelate epimerase
MNELAALRYVKGHGTANDFIVLADPEAELELTERFVRAVCDRRTGLGADGVLRVVRTDRMPDAVAGDEPDARWFMDYRNADGSVAEMCGNGIRVFARYLIESGFAAPGRLRIATRDGIKTVDAPASGDVTVDMGVAQTLGTPCEVVLDGVSYPGVAVSVGNPHVVVAVDDPQQLGDLDGLRVTPADAFPDGVNVEFVARVRPNEFRVRVHERGVGETFSCGTGACAVVAALGESSAAPSYAVDLPGGRLRITRCDDGHLLLSGPAVLVAQGVLRDEWRAEAERQ